MTDNKTAQIAALVEALEWYEGNVGAYGGLDLEKAEAAALLLDADAGKRARGAIEAAKEPTGPSHRTHIFSDSVDMAAQATADVLAAKLDFSEADDLGFKTVRDVEVLNVWRDKETGDEIHIPPTFYEDNGTPLGDNGADMAYVRTEVDVVSVFEALKADFAPTDSEPENSPPRMG